MAVQAAVSGRVLRYDRVSVKANRGFNRGNLQYQETPCDLTCRCQRHPDAGQRFMTSWVEGRVIGRRQWTDTLYSIQIEAEIAAFTAGQFTRLALEIDGEIVARPYSFVNGPKNPVHEFYYIIVADGPLTHQLAKLQAGDTVLIAPRAAGFFILDEVPGADYLWMLSTGTAIGPFLSILTTDEAWQRFKRIVLVHAVRTAAELSYQAEIGALLEQHPEQLQFIPFVSQEEYRLRDQGARYDSAGKRTPGATCRTRALRRDIPGHDLR